MAGKIQTKSRKSSSLSPLKRKSDLLPAEKGEESKETKRQKPINPPEELRFADQKFNAGEIKSEHFISAEEKKRRNPAEEEDEEESVISSIDDNEVISDDYDVEGFLSDESLEIMEIGNILSDRVRPRDSLKVLSRVKNEGNDGDDISDLDFCVDEQDLDEEEQEDDEDDDDDVENFLSDDSLTLMEVGNILSERMRPRDSLKVLSHVKNAKNVDDDADDRDYCVDDEQEEDEDDEEMEIEKEEEHHEVDIDGNNNDDDDDDVEKFLSDESLTLIEVGNILLERTRPCDSLKLVNPIKRAKNVCDDVDDCDYCVDEQKEDEDDDEKEMEMEEEKDDEKEQQPDAKNGNSDDDDIEKFLSDDSLTLIEVNNILLKRTRTRDTVKLLSPIKKVKNDDDDVNDLDYGVDEQDFEEDEEIETETKEEEQDDEEEKKKEDNEEEQKQVDKDGNNDDDDVENLLPSDSLILLERTRPCDSFKALSPIKKAKNDVDDVNGCNDFVNEQEEDEEDEKTETDTEEKENNETKKRRDMRIRRRWSKRMMKRIIR